MSMKLKPIQEQLVPLAVDVLRAHNYLYLALETRVGKTPVSLMAAFQLADKVLFATKKSAMADITDTLSGLSKEYGLEGKDVQIVSYDSLHKIPVLGSDWIIIADEAHGFGAYPKPALRAKELHRISKNCKVIMLSATPTPESYSMIYHQLWAANVDIPLTNFKNFYAWAAEYVDVKKKKVSSGMLVNDYSHAKKELILPQIEPYMIAATKTEAGFTQTAIKEIFLKAEVPEDVKALIATVKKDRVAYHSTEQGEIVILADTAAKLLSKEHQLASGTVIPEGSKEGIVLSTHKLPLLRFAMMRYKRVAIFYKFIAEKKMLLDYLGDTATEDNQEFNVNPEKVFIGQFISKREGINLEKADAIICLNIDFAYLSYIQMINRMMSYNRTAEAVVVWLFSDNGIEEAIYKAVAKKKNYTAAYYKRRLKKEGIE